jgi:hypothetical protein
LRIENYSRKKESRIRGKTTKMPDREDKKMARFLPLKKEETKKIQVLQKL